MVPLYVVEAALKKWHHPTTALQKLVKMKVLNTNVLCASCILWSMIEPDDGLFSLPTLQMLLERLPVQMQSEALSLTTNGDDARTALLLTQFSIPVPQGLTPLVQSLRAHWVVTGRCDDLALHFYRSLPAYGMPWIGQLWLLVQVYETRQQFVEAERLLQQIVQVHASPEAWWHLILVSHELHRPALARLEGLINFIKSDRNDTRIGQALDMIGEIIRTSLQDTTIKETLFSSIEMLRTLFMLFATQERSALLAQLTRNDEELMASLLILLASPIIPGLQAVAQTIITRWEEIPRHDALAMVFYAILVDYSIDTEKVYLLRTRAFVAKGMFDQAEHLLQHSQELQTSPDAIWLLVLKPMIYWLLKLFGETLAIG